MTEDSCPKKSRIGALIAFIALLCACATPEPDAATAIPQPALTATATATAATVTAPPLPAATEEQTPMPSPTTTTPDSGEPFIALARQDLAERLGIDADTIVVESFEAVIWPDRSLGCPQPGIEYRQVTQDGYHIVLRVEKETYAYHGGGTRGPFLCETAGAPQYSPPPSFGDS